MKGEYELTELIPVDAGIFVHCNRVAGALAVGCTIDGRVDAKFYESAVHSLEVLMAQALAGQDLRAQITEHAQFLDSFLHPKDRTP
jgi:hypothetical protein